MIAGPVYPSGRQRLQGRKPAISACSVHSNAKTFFLSGLPGQEGLQNTPVVVTA